MASDEVTRIVKEKLEMLEMMLTAYNKHLRETEKQLTGPELERQKAAFMEKYKSILNRMLDGTTYGNVN